MHEEQRSFDGTLVAVSYISTLVSLLIIPILIWVIKRDEGGETEQGLRDVMNYGISYSIYLAISSLLMIVLIGFVTTPLIGLALVIFSIYGAVKTAGGERWRPPFVLNLL
ncbi:MAG TPA: DUF4870 domain-containing protein [Aliicoccus persicus]|uniref:DUF4870 domain-containing protein n=1 Tax=Aliicoccus persicus TaxID=930138 RepID=A0A921DWE9_9STAP|nr:DUF4870 domain-containing protein [Aliicoccus persicus]